MGSRTSHVSRDTAPANISQLRKGEICPFLKQSNQRSLLTPASIDFWRGVLDLVLLGLRLKPTQDKIDRILAIERVPVNDPSTEEDSPEEITSLLVYRALHNIFSIGIARKNLTPTQKPQPSPYPCHHRQASFRGWRQRDTGAKNVEASCRQGIQKAGVNQVHRFRRH